MHLAEMIVAVVALLGSGGLALGYVFIKNDARVKLAQHGAKTPSGAAQADIEALRTDIAELRKQIADLRDTTTSYDLSFDTALRRLEQRLEQVESTRSIQR